MTVLVLTEQVDPTADRVINLLNEREVPVLRADTSWFPQHMDVAGELVNGEWAGQSAAERRHAAYEAKFGLGGMLWSLRVLWVNHPARQADLYKPTQLAVAARVGLAVPDTLVTNRPDAVCGFAADHPAGVVVKQLSFASIDEGSGRRALYTHLLNGRDLESLDGVEHTCGLPGVDLHRRSDPRTGGCRS